MGSILGALVFITSISGRAIVKRFLEYQDGSPEAGPSFLFIRVIVGRHLR